MSNDIQEKGLNKNADMNINIRKYPGVSLTDIFGPCHIISYHIISCQTKFEKRTRSNLNSCRNKQPNKRQ